MQPPRKQEQEPASSEVTEVAPDVLRLQLPINFDGLGHVNTYALIDHHGAALVDPGLPGARSWRALRSRLRSAEIPMRHVHTVVVTHSHPDHFGGAGRLARDAGAELMAHRLFHTWLRRADRDCVTDDADTDRQPDLRTASTPWGTRPPRPPRRQLLMFWATRAGVNPYFVPPTVTNPVDDGARVVLGGREWQCIHTPGHTADHLCLYDPENAVLLSGDHVLPSITPHVPGLTPDTDPLARYLESLDKVAGLGPVSVALPAHGHPFSDLAGRVAQIRRHHDQRLDELRMASAALGPATVTDLSHELFHRTRWGAMAESETYAHLEHLRLSGQAERREIDDHLVYVVESRSAATEKGGT